jgi:hypothetical protein
MPSFLSFAHALADDLVTGVLLDAVRSAFAAGRDEPKGEAQ